MEPQSKQVLRVLHVDDKFIELKRVRNILLKNQLSYPFIVESVSTEEEFWQKASANHPDIALIDIRLSTSGEEGLSITERLRRTHPDTVIVIRSSFDDPATLQKSVAFGADDFVSKHCNDMELALRLTNTYTVAAVKRGARRADETQAKNVPPVIGETLGKISARIPNIIASAVRSIHVSGDVAGF